MLYFATLFDKNYLPKGLALHQSLQSVCSKGFHLFVLALDDSAADFLRSNKIPSITVLEIKDLVSNFPELTSARENRSKIEFFFTLSPFLPSYILQQFSYVNRITTLDSDIYFYNDPQEIFARYPAASIMITPHSFAPELEHLTKYGKFNVSFQSFANDIESLTCLNVWRTQCAEWCYDELDEPNRRYADQKYLDDWSDKYKSLKVIDMPGAGLAPWNVSKYDITANGQEIFVSGERLIYYHYHHLRVFNRFFAVNAFEEYDINQVSRGLREIYHRYLNILRKIEDKFRLFSTAEIRYLHYNKSFFQKMRETDGYFFFTERFIFQLNPNKGFYSKIIKASSTIHGNINRLGNFYRRARKFNRN